MSFLMNQQAPDTFEWYIFESSPPQSSPVLERAVRLGPFATENECRALLDSIRGVSRFTHSTLEVRQRRKRREKRVKIQLPVQLCRSATDEKSLLAYTVDVSNSGARLAGLREPLKPGEVLEVHCGRRQAVFQVVWIGSPGEATEGQAGVEGLTPEANIWELDLSEQADDEPLLQEIAVARSVQARLLPQELPLLQTLGYSGHCIQARTVGGDYYDFLDLGRGKVGFVMADIAGKGIAAALLMANLQGSLRSQAGVGGRDLPEVLASVNRHFYRHTETSRYATVFFGCYDDATRNLRYVNCGHNSPLLLREHGVERLHATATVLGLFPIWEGSVGETPLQAGDILSIYTDGITEATGRHGEEFGETRLLETLRENRGLEATAIVQKVEAAVEQFRSGDQEDDLTLVVARAW